MTVATARLGELMSACGNKAGNKIELPVYSVTKHEGFVKSLQYFKKQVYSRDLSNYILVRDGDFAYATIHLDEGSIGIAPQDCLISPMYTTFRANSRVNPRYLLRFLKSPRAIGEYTKLGKGSVHRRKSISLTSLSRLQVPLPTLEEQQRIAQVLDQVDALRAKRRGAIARLDELAQSLFLDMFGDPDSSWPRKTVSQISKKSKGSIRTGPFGSQLLHEEFVDHGVAVLGIDNVTRNEFQREKRRCITHQKYEKLARYTVHPGDVLISIMGTCGRCAVAPHDIPLTINTKHLCCISLDQQQCLPDFLHSYFLIHPVARQYLDNATRGAIMSGLNMSIIKELPVALPPLQLQQSFVDRIHSTRAAKTTHQTHLAKLDELFASLQYRAFRGELFDSPN